MRSVRRRWKNRISINFLTPPPDPCYKADRHSDYLIKECPLYHALQIKELPVIKSRRAGVRKGPAARHFRNEVGRTHPKNMRARPMRGGFRL